MPPSIILEVTHPDLPPGPIDGFKFVWAYYVSGFKPEHHCQVCFSGMLAPNFHTGSARSGVRVELTEAGRFPFVYVCGVARGLKAELGARNFHFPLRYREGSVAEATTYNGYTVRAENAEALPIPEKMPAGWEGRDQEHLGCKNFRFGLEYFGLHGERYTSTANGDVSHQR